MAIYRLTIYHQQKQLGHFESDTPHSRQAVRDILQRLPANEGFTFELQVAHSERRIIEADTQGIRILAREAQFKSIELAALLNAPM